jgi:HK97 family phage major capsid protein
MPTATVDRSRVRELNAALQTKANEIERISAAFDIDSDGNISVTTEQAADYKKAISDAEQIKSLIEAEEKASTLREFIKAPEGTSPAGAETAESARASQNDYKSLAQRWLNSEAYKEMADSNWTRFGQMFNAEKGLGEFDLQAKDIYSAMAGTVTLPTLGSQQNLGLTPRMLRPGRVRSLFPAESTTANLLYGIREVGFTNRAAVVPERTAADGGPATGGPTDVFGLKPRSDLQLVPVTYPLATIAHLMFVHRQTLADEPRMQGIIDRDLIDGIKMVEDEQILYGDGIGDNLTGLVNTPGIQTYTGLAADPRTAQIRRAITRVTLAYFQPTGIVLHPLDWEDLELERDNTGAYRLAVNIAVGAQKTMWRLNVVDTPAINEGQCLLGAYGFGAKLYDREQVNIAVSTENRDMFERNAVTLRCEERLGLVVDRPESFCLLSLTTPA